MHTGIPFDEVWAEYLKTREDLTQALDAFGTAAKNMGRLKGAGSLFKEMIRNVETHPGRPSEEARALLEKDKDLSERYRQVLTACHEAAHVLVADQLGLDYEGASILATEYEGMGGHLQLVDFDPETDGPAPDWKKRFATMCYAGFAGNKLVIEPKWLNMPRSDYTQAEDALREVGLFESKHESLRRAAATMVQFGSHGIWGVALSLWVHKKIDKPLIQTQLSIYLDKRARTMISNIRESL
jgi:hypothetical protein